MDMQAPGHATSARAAMGAERAARADAAFARGPPPKHKTLRAECLNSAALFGLASSSSYARSHPTPSSFGAASKSQAAPATTSKNMPASSTTMARHSTASFTRFPHVPSKATVTTPFNPHAVRAQYRVPVPKSMPKTRAADNMRQLAANCVDQAIEEAAMTGEGECESTGTDVNNKRFVHLPRNQVHRTIFRGPPRWRALPLRHGLKYTDRFANWQPAPWRRRKRLECLRA